MTAATKKASKAAANSATQSFSALLDHENEGDGSTGFFEVPAAVVEALGQERKRLARTEGLMR